MKYIKTFERNDLNYNFGDYVYVTSYPSIDNFCKISNVNRARNRTWDYNISYFQDGVYYTGYMNGILIDEEDIDRKLTEEEIDEFNARIESSKYNL